ncbi:MAG: 4-hydroxy-tetrahydrodipicolinate synthase [Candidatus Improbicoccus devescovinae]|nr:MAG: 4-hydroxy-tetrahydrodipicolinate synthase [Candidatus Improbicoccus devescovinae]
MVRKNIIFKGSGVALVTPMNLDESINYDCLEKLVEFNILNNTQALVICATTGEGPVLSFDERKEIIEFVVNKTNGRIPVIVGTGSLDTKHAVKLSLQAQELGANGLLIVTPYYNKTSQRGIIEYYKYISDRVNLPIIIYNNPTRTGLNILPETYLELSKLENIVATKEANGDVSSAIKTKALCRDNLNIYTGNDDQMLPLLSIGGIGGISAFANICPKEMQDLYEFYVSNNTQKALDLLFKYNKLIHALFSIVNPIPVKTALNMMGFECGSCRMPLVEMPENLKLELKQELIEKNIINN